MLRSSGWSSCTRGPRAARLGPVPLRTGHRSGLGAGGAGEHGRMGVCAGPLGEDINGRTFERRGAILLRGRRPRAAMPSTTSSRPTSSKGPGLIADASGPGRLRAAPDQPLARGSATPSAPEWQTVGSGCMSLLPDLHCVGGVGLHFAVAVSWQRHCADGPKRPLDGEQARR